MRKSVLIIEVSLVLIDGLHCSCLGVQAELTGWYVSVSVLGTVVSVVGCFSGFLVVGRLNILKEHNDDT